MYFLLNLFLTELFGASFLIAISAITSASLYASVIVPSILMIFILASGNSSLSLSPPPHSLRRSTTNYQKRIYNPRKSNSRMVDLALLGFSCEMVNNNNLEKMDIRVLI